MVREIKPQPGPQSEFCKAGADIAIYGGAAGGGKSWALVYSALRHVEQPGYAAIIFRRLTTQLVGGGSVWEESTKLYAHAGGRPREHTKEWRFPSGASIEFDHLQYEKDVYSHQSKQYAFVGFDELTQFSQTQFFYLLSRLRTASRVRPYVRGTCNPDADSWVRPFIDWWVGEDGQPIPERSGVIRWMVRVNDAVDWADTPGELLERHPTIPKESPLSVTFIPAKLSDNPILEENNPRYRAFLQALDAVERARLAGGNWNIRPAGGLYFRREWFEVVDPLPASTIVHRWRAWDRAATKPHSGNPDPDWTRGVKLARLRSGLLAVEHVTGCREGPSAVEQLVRTTASQDGRATTIGLWQDPGAAGKSDAEHYVRALSQYTTTTVVAREGKITYAGPVSSAADPSNGGSTIVVVRGPWNDEFFGEVEAFPTGNHDDQVDALALAYLLAGDAPEYAYNPVATSSRFKRRRGLY
jgi:predicted phage terminase large subunit-like protein